MYMNFTYITIIKEELLHYNDFIYTVDKYQYKCKIVTKTVHDFLLDY
jgi:hypothetical protein